MISLSSLITTYFSDYLPKIRGYSRNTIESYMTTFILLLNYSEENGLCPKGKVKIDVLSKANIIQFLEWLETDRGVSVSTRNQRLAALKSFCKYASLNSVENLDAFQQILDISPKKGLSKEVDYLTVNAISLLLKQPNIKTYKGIRDLAILSLLYESGCRVQEIIDTKVGNINFKSPSTITVIGKGSKVRTIPLSPNLINILNKFIEEYKLNDPRQYMFTNSRKEKLTRSGIGYILDKYVQMAKKTDSTLFGEIKMHPHVLRHSKAMHLLESGVNLIYIRDFLGHSSVITTEIYARSNPEIKRKYLEKAALKIDVEIDKYSVKEKETLLRWLKENL